MRETHQTQKTVEQHYVPRHYLKNFKDSSGKLWVYNKETDKHFPSGEQRIAFENGFYDLVAGSMENEGAEEWNAMDRGERVMARFDLELDRVLKLLLSEGRYVGVRNDNRTATAFAMAIQHIRTITFREGILQSLSENLNTLSTELVKLNFPGKERFAPTVVVSDGMVRHEHVKALLNYDTWRLFGDAISSHHWTLCIAPPGSHFITSDEPVSIHYRYAGKMHDATGIKSKGVEIVYPLSSQFALVTRERSLPQIPSNNGGPGKVTSDFVNYCNCLVAANCRRFVMGDSPDFALIREFFNLNPSLRNRSWGRWETKMTKPKRITIKRRKQLKQHMISQRNFIDIRWPVQS